MADGPFVPPVNFEACLKHALDAGVDVLLTPKRSERLGDLTFLIQFPAGAPSMGDVSNSFAVYGNVVMPLARPERDAP